ncbi:MAG: RHS repeat-associated core domain-containing protein, partial [Candidatus Acidiferrum sp.]
MSGNIGLPTITYGAEGEGRPSTVSASSGQNPVTAANYYNLYQSPYQLSVTFGSGDSDVFTFDPNTFRLNKYQFNVGSQAVTGTLGWNANWSLGSLGISDPFSAANTQTCSFTADDLSRISQTNCGTIWAQTFSYDPFGNIQTHQTAGSGTSFAPTYASSPITNRISTVGGTSATYDANGNSLYDTFRTFSWDADSNPITIGSVTLTYDAFDRMVEQSVASTHSEIVYGPAGVKFALMNGTTLAKAFVPLPGGATAVYTSSGLAYYRHTDHLGSSRFASTPTQTRYADLAYSPFGEPYAQSGAIDPSFTGQNQDTTAGLYDFLFREHDPNQARWTSPDPSGLSAVDPTDPQSWNRYVYVRNAPLNLVDPLGLEIECLGGRTYDYIVPYVDDQYAGSDLVYIGDSCGGGGGGSGAGGSGGGGNTSGPSIPTPAEAATKFCEDHGQVASTIRGTNIPITASLSATAGPVNYNTKNEITPVIPAFPWPEWLSFGAGVDVGINVPTGSTPSWSIGLGKNLGVSLFSNAQGKTTGVNLNIGLSIG